MKKAITPYPKVCVRKTSIGKGIFACEDIKKDTKILQYIGKIITTEEADAKPNRYIFEINEKWSIDGSPFYNTARYFNHACKSNAYSTMDTDTERIFIAARRNITKGEEITFDYGEDYKKMYFKRNGCKCSQCRKVF